MATNEELSKDDSLKPNYELTIIDLPLEVLEKIFSYLSFEQIGKIRTVCHSFNDVCSNTLNSTFQWLQNLTLHRFQQIKSQMPRRESARRSHPLSRECDIVETVNMRLSLLQMTFGKHIERKHCCFFTGEILDETNRILRHVKTTPNLCRTYKVTDELFDLTTMAMEYFKENIEPDLPEITYFASDFLDYNNFSAGPSGVKVTITENSSTSSTEGVVDDNQDSPTTNVVLRKKLKRLRQGMKKYNSRLAIVKRELRNCRGQLQDQQMQMAEYGLRFEEYDKKLEENSRKYSTLLQELNKCKTELRYWRSKSPANAFCCSCSSTVGGSNEDPIAVADDDEEDESSGVMPVPESSVSNINSNNNNSNSNDDNSCGCHKFIPIKPEEETGSTQITLPPTAGQEEVVDLISGEVGTSEFILQEKSPSAVGIPNMISSNEESGGSVVVAAAPSKRKPDVEEHLFVKRQKSSVVKCLLYN